MAAGKKEGKTAARAALRPRTCSPAWTRRAPRFSGALGPELARQRGFLQAMREEPPQLLHLEGGDASSRVALALWWAALLNCEEQGDEPCLRCHSCLSIGARMHPIFFCSTAAPDPSR